MTTLLIRQDAPIGSVYPIRLTLKRTGRADLEAEARIHFSLTEQEQEDLRWYLEDYLQRAETVEAVTVQQIETTMKLRGEELYKRVLVTNAHTQALWFSVRNNLADLRIEIASGVAQAASIPWELMRDPEIDSPISLRVKSFVRVQSNPNIDFVDVPPEEDGRIRLLYVVCRPCGSDDVELRAVANRLLQDLGADRSRFRIKALRPPTFEQLQKELGDAKEEGRPYHIVHFDGHGVYADLSDSRLADWIAALSTIKLGTGEPGKHGYLLFEHSSKDKMRPIDGQTIGQLLHDSGVPVLVLNACRSAMHEATAQPETAIGVHDEIRAIGSLAQAVVDQGVPAVLGMRYSIYVVTAAQYVAQLYAALAKGRSFGQAATDGRKHLQRNPDRWVGLYPRPLQDWFVPVAYEAAPLEVLSPRRTAAISQQPELDPVQHNRLLLRHIPDEGFIGRDETLLALDRAFDNHRVVLLHAYAGQGKSSTAVEFARWYALTGGLGDRPIVLFTSFESHTDLNDILNQIGQLFTPLLEAQGILWSAVNDVDKRRDLVVHILRSLPSLWIWDNVESVAGFPQGADSQWTLGEQNDLRDFLKQLKFDSTSEVKILLTSRRDEQTWLDGIPHRIAMRPMTKSDAARLALTIGEERKLTREDVAQWEPLLDYCCGNPLTLKVLTGQAVSLGLRTQSQISSFVEAIRTGEQRIEDANANQGRDKSLAASLEYGFRHTFKDDELPVVALLALFQRTVDVAVLQAMGDSQCGSLPELADKTQEQIISLMKRAADGGLLTHWHDRWFMIHPAVPWFLSQFFTRLYDGTNGRSTSLAALKAWVKAVGLVGHHYYDEHWKGNQDATRLLEMEEANLLHARRLARQNQWWTLLTPCMQGLHALYEHHGRMTEWARLVEEITSDYCANTDEPVLGREEKYSLVMSYRIRLARRYEHNLTKAAVLLEKDVTYVRQQAAPVLALPAETLLNDEQRRSLQAYGATIFELAQIRREEGHPAALELFQESLDVSRRLGRKELAAQCELQIGHLLSTVPDLAAAEAAYRRSMDLWDEKGLLHRAICLKHIGMVYQQRFLHGSQSREYLDKQAHDAREAEALYLRALQLCPAEAVNEVAMIHGQLGEFYSIVGDFGSSREHYERAVQGFEESGDRFRSGHIRLAMSGMFLRMSEGDTQPAQRLELLLRVRAYAEAALRDWAQYPGRADIRLNVQRLIDHVNHAISALGS